LLTFIDKSLNLIQTDVYNTRLIIHNAW